jgi:hypothetical protein
MKSLCKGSFEFRSTKNGTRVVTKEMADFAAIRSYFDSQNLHYFTFYPKSQKPIKAVIRHLPLSTPAEDISDGLVNLRFDIISVKQMSTTRRSSTDGPNNVNLPLFLITLPRTPKSQDIFKIINLCYIAKWRPREPRLASRNVTTARSSAMSGQIARNLHVVCGVEAVTCTRTARKKET